MALPLACLLSLLATGPAAAQSDPYNGRTFSRTPAEGPPGTIIHVSGTGCIYQGKPYDNAYVDLFNHSFSGPDVAYSIGSDGSWGGTFTVPLNTPFDTYTLSAYCQAADMQFTSGQLTFVVGYPPPPKPTATATPRHSPTPQPTHTPSPTPPVAVAVTPSPSPVSLTTRPAAPPPSNIGKPNTSPISRRGSILGPAFLIIAAVLVCAAVVRRVLVRHRR